MRVFSVRTTVKYFLDNLLITKHWFTNTFHLKLFKIYCISYLKLKEILEVINKENYEQPITIL